MKRSASAKKSQVERRKRPRGKAQASRKSVAAPHTARTRAVQRAQRSQHPGAAVAAEDACYHCSKDLTGNERALFVEEEIGRVFCSEACITSYFSPEIERLEKDYLKRVSAGDLSAEERESLSHLRWITLQEADEVWREKTLTGDHRYTLVSEFQPGTKRIWCVCICLFLRGEPSFLYIAFTTRSAALVNAYRRGERMQWDKKPAQIASMQTKVKSSSKKRNVSEEADNAREVEAAQAQTDGESSPENGDLGDRLADAWTEDETFLAQMNQKRSHDDIPPEEFDLFQSCLEETLETPDEVWSVEMSDPEGVHLYHFIREYKAERPGHWYVIVARETENEEQIEILDAFPTRDINLVDRYRRGTQEVGESVESRPASRLVH